MTKLIKACIFDLDGVIVDTAKYHYLAWKRLAKELGFDFSIDDNERLKGVSRMQSLEILLQIGGITLTDNEKQIAADKKNSCYVEYILNLAPEEILPGVNTFLTQVKKAGVKSALGSASKNAPMILERLNLVGFFNAVIDGSHISNAKPDPEVFLKGAEALGVKPDQCIVFEDAQAGIEAAKNGGMYCVALGKPENLKGADVIIPGFATITFDEILFKMRLKAI